MFLEPVIEVMFFICSSTKAYHVKNQKLKEQGNQPKHRLALNFTQDFQIELKTVGFACFREHGID